MFGGLKQGKQLPMDEVMTYLRSLQGCKWPALMIQSDGVIRVVDQLTGRLVQAHGSVDKFLEHIRK